MKKETMTKYVISRDEILDCFYDLHPELFGLEYTLDVDNTLPPPDCLIGFVFRKTEVV